MSKAATDIAPRTASDDIERACERLRSLDQIANKEQLWGKLSVEPIYQGGRIVKIDFRFEGGDKLN